MDGLIQKIEGKTKGIMKVSMLNMSFKKHITTTNEFIVAGRGTIRKIVLRIQKGVYISSFEVIVDNEKKTSTILENNGIIYNDKFLIEFNEKLPFKVYFKIVAQGHSFEGKIALGSAEIHYYLE